MGFNINNICNLQCIAGSNNEYINMLENNSEHDYKILNNKTDYYISFAPVGNYVETPTVIISGKATSLGSSKLFKKEYEKSENLYNACFKSIYSNMKDNLYIYLKKIGLFDYLSIRNEFWKDNKKEKWAKIFEDENFTKNCGIQLTQAFNCGIINKIKSPSSEPTKKIMNEIFEIGCTSDDT